MQTFYLICNQSLAIVEFMKERVQYVHVCVYIYIYIYPHTL